MSYWNQRGRCIRNLKRKIDNYCNNNISTTDTFIPRHHSIFGNIPGNIPANAPINQKLLKYGGLVLEHNQYGQEIDKYFDDMNSNDVFRKNLDRYRNYIPFMTKDNDRRKKPFFQGELKSIEKKQQEEKEASFKKNNINFNFKYKKNIPNQNVRDNKKINNNPSKRETFYDKESVNSGCCCGKGWWFW